jgi:hypothetical protein
MRAIAERIVAESPAFCAVHGIDAGDALALATRFDSGWAYRGRQALFWSKAFHAHEVHDRYLPAPPLRPFDRRGLLEVRGTIGNEKVTLVAAQLGNDRSRVRELRLLRSTLRAIHGTAYLFIAGYGNDERIGFADLAFRLKHSDEGCVVFARL